MNQQQCSSATISSTRSNKRSRVGHTVIKKDYNGVLSSQSAPPPNLSTEGNHHHCASVNDEILSSQPTQTALTDNLMDNNVEVTISHSSNTTGSKRPRSRSGSTGSCNGNQPPLSSNAAGSNDKTEDRTNNSATTNKAVSSNRIKCPSQVPQMTEDYVELASHMMLHPLSQIRAATLLASGQTTATTTTTKDDAMKMNGSKQTVVEDNHSDIATKIAMTPQSQYLVHLSALGYLKSAIRQPTVIEKWSPYEIAMFEASIAEYGKNFSKIQNEIGRTKSVSEVIEFYYIWKKTSHYAQWKKEYIPEYLDVDVDE